MKLIYRVISRLSIALLILLAVWAALFYVIITEEINDETDDSLEDYSEYIIMRALAGEELPSQDNGTNNSYYIEEVTPEYAAQTKGIRYLDDEIYIETKKETEPARVLKTIFRDRDERYHELTVSIPTFEKSDLQETILLWIILLYVILLLAIMAVNAWIIYRSFRPLYSLLDWLDNLKLGGAIPPLDNRTKVTEFRRLNEAMMRHAQRNNDMYEEQQLFIGNASHELQTPVAICQNRLEILSEDAALTEEQLGEILKVRQALDHLSKLNKSLLLLTRIDNRQFPDTAEIDINTLLRNLIADYSEVFAYRQITLTFTEEATVTIRMNETLASVLYSNLLKNAFIHTPQNGTIEVVVSKEHIAISNSAENGPLPAEEIFRRFYQGRKKEGSLGLGLSLITSIGRLYNMRVGYDFTAGKHRFTVTIPFGK